MTVVGTKSALDLIDESDFNALLDKIQNGTDVDVVISSTVADTANKVNLTLTQNDTTNNPNVVLITNTGTGNDIQIATNSAKITHSGTTSLTIASTSGTVIIESVTFTAGALTGVTSISDGTASWSSSSLSGFTNISLSTELDLTGTSAVIDLNPAHTGSVDVVDLTPTGVLAAGSTWRGFYITPDALAPATGAASVIAGFQINSSGLNSTDGNALVYGMHIRGSPTDLSYNYYSALTEKTNTSTTNDFTCAGGTVALSTSATYRGLFVSWDSLTRDANAPILEGVRVVLPADYTSFGANFAGYFSGDGRTVTVCDTTYALDVSGAMNFAGAVTGVTTLGLVGDVTISGNTANITHSGTTSLTIISTNGTVVVESVTFTGGVITGASMSADQISAGALNIGANAFTVNSVEIVGSDGVVNAAAIEDAFLANNADDTTTGRLTADKGFAVTIANTVNQTGLTIVQNDTTNNPYGISVTSTAAKPAIFVDMNANSGALNGAIHVENTGNINEGLVVTSGQTSAQTRALVKFLATDTTFDQAVFEIQQNGTSQAINLILDGTGKMIDFDCLNGKVSGTILEIDWSQATTLTGAIVAFDVDLSTNVTASNFSISGFDIILNPAVTNTTAAGSFTYKNEITGGAITTSPASGSITTGWYGWNIQMPNITATAGAGENATNYAYALRLIGPTSATLSGGGGAETNYISCIFIDTQGNGYGIDFSGMANTEDVIQFQTADTTAAGAYFSRVPVKVNGSATQYYLHLFAA